MDFRAIHLSKKTLSVNYRYSIKTSKKKRNKGNVPLSYYYNRKYQDQDMATIISYQHI